MPVIDVPLDKVMPDGTIHRVTVRVTATDAKDALTQALAGKGLTLDPGAMAPRPTQTPEPALFAEPVKPPDATVYRPPTRGEAPANGPILAPVFDALTQTVAPAVGRFVGRAALPTIGSLALQGGGAAVPGLSALPAPVRAGLGSMLGTGANMALGIEEPSWQQLLLAGMTPASAQGGARLGTGLLPGARGARAAGLVEEAQQLPGLLREGVPDDVGAFYAEARRQNPSISLTATARVAKDLLKREAEAGPGLGFRRVQTVADELKTLGTPGTEKRVITLKPVLNDLGVPIAEEQIITITPGRDGRIPLAQLDTVRQRIGALIADTTNTEERAAYKQLYGNLLTDIETAAATQGGDGARVLLQGIQHQRRAFAADDLQDLLTGATSQPRPVDGLQTINFGKILKAVKTPRTRGDELLAGWMAQHPTEQAEILTRLEDMNKRNVRIMPPAGTMFGSGAMAGRAGAGYLVGTGVNTLAGEEMVNPGTVAALSVFGSQLISRALLTRGGREFLRQMYTDSGVINVTQLAVQLAGQGTRSGLGSTPLSSVAGFLRSTTGFPGAPAPSAAPAATP